MEFGYPTIKAIEVKP